MELWCNIFSILKILIIYLIIQSECIDLYIGYVRAENMHKKIWVQLVIF